LIKELIVYAQTPVVISVAILAEHDVQELVLYIPLHVEQRIEHGKQAVFEDER
jgi:hypothetical protein